MTENMKIGLAFLRGMESAPKTVLDEAADEFQRLSSEGRAKDAVINAARSVAEWRGSPHRQNMMCGLRQALTALDTASEGQSNA